MSQSLHRIRTVFARFIGLAGLASAATWGMASAACGGPSGFDPDDLAFFESQVRPLLAARCYECHSERAEEVGGGLRLDRRDLVLRGGDRGPALLVEQPLESLLLKAVRYEAIEMPPSGKLAEEEIAILERWISRGAAWPEEVQPTSGLTDPATLDWAELRRSHWSFRPVIRPALPRVEQAEWPQQGIDRFVLARLEAAGLKPSPPAEPRTLIRRIYHDLIGFPPAPEDVDAFTSAFTSNRERSVERLVDRLLASPHYGERWGRHWLDVARYSDFDSGSNPLPHAWKYRDWVVAAFNRDLPYDRFAWLQIAGDLSESQAGGAGGAGGDASAAVATGFFAVGPLYSSDGGDPDGVAKAKGATLDDRVDLLTRGFLALTVSCARCHDHKFDPIPTLDYYSLAGIFNNTTLGAEHEGEAIKRQTEAGAHVLGERGSSDMRVALRGNLRNPGEVAPRRFLRILAGPNPPRVTAGSGRRELADAIANPRNPLTSRVIVNRAWQHHFGKGIVATPSNFGTLGNRPTHPNLLDWLATEFIQSGWSLKRLHRMIVTSSAYQQSAQFRAAAFQVDGDNRLIWRMNPRRMNAESWRDTMLTVTGERDAGLGGPPAEEIHGRRRTLYCKVSRSGDRFATDEFLRLFDFPLMQATVAKRQISVVPQQFLFLLNSRFMVDRAQALVDRLEREAESDESRVEHAYRLLYGRSVTEDELRLGMEYLDSNSDRGEGRETRWLHYAQVLLSSNELMYVR